MAKQGLSGDVITKCKNLKMVKVYAGGTIKY